MPTKQLSKLLEQYTAGAQGTSPATNDPKSANRCHDKMHEAYKLLRVTPVGREMISRLLSHSSPHVRCWAAAHSLEWDLEAAVRTLETLRDEGGLLGFEAEIVLKEYEKGRLTFDY